MKQSEIRIYTAKGGYRVKLYGANGEQLSTSEVLTTPRNVVKNIDAQYIAFANDSENTLSCTKWFAEHPIDHTKGQYFAKKYNWRTKEGKK